MQSLSIEEVRRKLRESDPVKIVRGWISSAFIGEDSRSRQRNPEYHPPIYQREDGVFVDIEGRVLPKTRVPEYVRVEGASLLPETPYAERREMTMAAAMVEADARAQRADAPSPESQQPRRPRGRPRKNA